MKLKELFTDESKWTKGCGARDANGDYTEVDNNDAVCWCLLGGTRKCYAENREEIVNKIYDYLWLNFQESFISHWNDDATFEQVQKLVNDLDI